MCIRFSVVAPVLAACLAFGATGRAQPAPPAGSAAPAGDGAAPAPPKDQASALFKKGLAAYDKGDFQEASTSWRAAWALKQTFDIAGNLGLVELKLGKFRDAAEHLDYAVKHFPPTDAEARRAGLQAKFAEARAQIGGLRITSVTAGADVLVDQVRVGTTPLGGEIFVLPGTHTIELVHRDYKPASQTIQVEKGSTKVVALTLEMVERGPSIPVLGVGYGLALLGVVGGAVFTVLSNSKAADAQDQTDALKEMTKNKRPCTVSRPECDSILALREDQDLFGNIAGGMFIGAGVAAIGTSIYLVMTTMGGKPSAGPTTGLRAVPILAPGQAGFSITSAW